MDPFEPDPDLARQVDAACRQFEAAWRASRPIPIEDCVVLVDPIARSALIRELVALEAELRQCRGERPAPSDYLGRFPEDSAAIDLIFAGPSESGVGSDEAIHPTTSPSPNPSETDADATSDRPSGPDARSRTFEFSPDPSTIDPATVEITEETARPGPSPNLIPYFGDYVLIHEIARGGMGVVYRARQISLNRPVALKMILSGQLAGEDAVRRFRIEAEAAANLDHPGIVPIYEIGEHDGQHFFSMGYIDGKSLAARVSGGPLPPREAAELARLTGEAIQYAHDKGVIHRDLKPANVLIDANGWPKVTDFGLAKRLESDSDLTRTGQIVGTPNYMPPEQAEGKPVGPLADVYSLGALLYCLLTGRPPFQAATPMETLRQVIEQEPAMIRQLNATVPRDLETIAHKALQKEPTWRYASAAAFTDDLSRYLDGRPILARPTGRAEHALRWCRRNPAVAGLAGLLLTVMIGATAASAWAAYEFDRQARRERVIAKSEKKQRERADDLAKQERKTAESERETRKQLTITAAENLQRQVGQVVGVAKRSMDAEDWSGALPWLAEALRLDADHPIRGPIHRARIGGVLSMMPRLLRLTALESAGKVLHISDGHVIAQDNGVILRIDPWTGESPRLEFEGLGGDNRVNHVGPDGRSVAYSEGNPRTSRFVIWNAEANRPTVTTTNITLEHPLLQSPFSPDGRRVIVISREGEIRTWEVVTGSEILPTVKPETKPTSVVPSPDGRLLAVVCADNNTTPAAYSVRFYDTDTGIEMGHALALVGSIYLSRIAFSPDSSRLAQVKSDAPVMGWDHRAREARVWDVHNGDLIAGPMRFLCNPERHNPCFEFSPDGHRLFTFGLQETRVWNLGSDDQVGRTLPIADVQSHAISPDGLALAVVKGNASDLAIWDVEKATPLMPTLRMSVPIDAIAFGPDGRTLISAGYSPTSKNLESRVWDITTGTKPGVLTIGNGWASDDGRWLIVQDEIKREGTSDRDHLALRVIDRYRGETLSTIALSKDHVATWVEASKDGGRLIALVDRQPPTGRIVLKAWALPSRQPLLETGEAPRIEFASISPDGRWAVALCGEYQKPLQAWLWDLDTGQSKPLAITPGRRVIDARFRQDSRRLVVLQDAVGRVWDTITGEPAGPPFETNTHGPINDIGSPVLPHSAFGMDGGALAATLDGTEIFRLDPDTGQPLPCGPIATNGRVLGLSSSGDGLRVIADIEHQAARVFELSTGKPVGPPFMADGTIRQVTLDANGHRGLVGFTSGRTSAADFYEIETASRIMPRIRDDYHVSRWTLTFDDHILGLDHTRSCRGNDRYLISEARSPDILRRVSKLISSRIVDDYGAESPPSLGLSSAEFLAMKGQVAELPEEPGESPEAWHYRKAKEATGIDQNFGALFHLDRLLAVNPGHADGRKRRIETLAYEGRWDKAIADLQAMKPSLINRDLDLALIHTYLGNSDGFREAAARFRPMAIQAATSQPAAMNTLLLHPDGISLVQSAAVIERVGKALDRNPEYRPMNYQGHASLGRLLYRRGDPEAVDALRLAIASYGRRLSPEWVGATMKNPPMPKPETILPDTPFGTPEDWFWVALAERKAGHEDLAQRWANRSIAWLDKAIVNPRDPSILGSKQEPILPVQSWSRGVQTTGIQSLGRSGDRMIDRGWIDPSWRDLLVLQILRKEFESMEKSGEPPPD